MKFKRLSLQDGDFIYNTRNAPDLVGKSAVFHGENGKYLFNNNILRIRFGSRALPDFVNTVMNSDLGKAKIRAQVDGTTSVAALYQKNYLAIEIPLHPWPNSRPSSPKSKPNKHWSTPTANSSPASKPKSKPPFPASGVKVFLNENHHPGPTCEKPSQGGDPKGGLDEDAP